MPKEEINGVLTCFQQMGDGPDIVLVHGLAASRAFWFLPVALPMRASHRVTVYDLRGHGDSAMPPDGYHLSSMADDLGALLDHLGLNRPVLVGHSLGGAVALHYALNNPARVSGLVLADTRVNPLQPQQRLADSPHLTPYESALLEASDVDWHSETQIGIRFLEEFSRDRYRGLRQRLSKNGFVPFGNGRKGNRDAAKHWRKLLETTTARADFRDRQSLDVTRLAAFHCPTLLLYGERSRCMPSCHALQKRLPVSRTVIVPDAGHFHPVTKPGVFLTALNKYLKWLHLYLQLQRPGQFAHDTDQHAREMQL